MRNKRRRQRNLALILAITICSIFFMSVNFQVPEETTDTEQIVAEDLSAWIDRTTLPRQPLDPMQEEINMIAQVLYYTGGQVPYMERAALAWCILNRKDSKEFPNTVEGVCSQPNQFSGYGKNLCITGQNLNIATDVLTRYYREKETSEDVGRILPSTYLYCRGDGTHLYFTEDLNGAYPWMYEYDNPYDREVCS